MCQRLRERLRDGVGREIGPPRIPEDGTPQALGLLSVEALDLATLLGHGRILHYP
jgi:hypothetical protein